MQHVISAALGLSLKDWKQKMSLDYVRMHGSCCFFFYLKQIYIFMEVFSC